MLVRAPACLEYPKGTQTGLEIPNGPVRLWSMKTVVNAQFLYLSVPETAKALGITSGRVRQLLLAGELHGHKLGDAGQRQWVIEASEVQRYQKSRRPPGRPAARASG